jgi:hypothetical protein
MGPILRHPDSAGHDVLLAIKNNTFLRQSLPMSGGFQIAGAMAEETFY